MKFILVCHTETDWNREKRIHGQSGVGLNATGRMQARDLSERIARLAINRIVSSDLDRAAQTALLLKTNHPNVPIEFDARLRECSFGAFEGKLREECLERYGAPWPEDCDPYDFQRFGGENREQVLARHLAVIQRLSSRHPDETILLVGHRRGLTTLWNQKEPGVSIPRGEYRILEAEDITWLNQRCQSLQSP